MAANLREASLSFNAAEAGLSAAETFVQSLTSNKIDSNPKAGLYDASDSDPNYQDPETWESSQDSGLSLGHGIDSPRFIVKYLGERSQNQEASINVGGYGSSQPGTTISYFRITAMGTGQTDNTRSYLQSYFGREH